MDAERRAADRTAESGLEYAASRLGREGYPRHSTTPLDRGDDWTFRQGPAAPLAGAQNPSYSHGEPWTDDGDGAREADEPVASDLDGDGRFSAWSGRLREGPARRAFFALKILADDGLVPVNAGYLDGDRNTNGIGDQQETAVHEYHQALAYLMDSLGTVLDIEWRRKPGPTGSSADPDDWIEPSWLGRDLLANRPSGGYRDPAEIDAVLEALGYPQTDRERILPFLSVGPYETPAESGRTSSQDTAFEFPPYAPINLATAPREVLTSLWVNLGAVVTSPAIFPGAPGDWSRPWTRTGGGLVYSHPQAMPLVFLDEARALAAATIALRQAGVPSWMLLRRTFLENALDLFPRDRAGLGGGLAALSYCQLKAQMAFQAVAADPYPSAYGTAEGSGTWAGWGLDRDGNVANGIQLPPCVSFEDLRGIRYPDAPQDPWSDPLAPYRKTTTVRIKPQGLTLAPPCRYRVASFGRGGGPATGRTFAGQLRAAERLDFTSQEDFEALAGCAGLAARGLAVSDGGFPPDRRRGWGPAEPLPDGTDAVYAAPDNPLDPVRLHVHVASLPRWNRRAYGPASQTLGTFDRGFSRLYGALALAGRETGLQGARLYWPFKEDFDERRDNGNVWTGGPHGDAWSEHETGYSPGEYLFPQLFVPAGMWDSPLSSPFQISDALPDGTPFECPGMTAPGDVLGFSIACWMGPGSSFRLKEAADPDSVVALSLARAAGTPDLQFRLEVNWLPRSGFTSAPVVATFTVPETAPLASGAWQHLVVLTGRKSGNNATEFLLHVNGGNVGDLPYPSVMRNTSGEKLKLSMCDEVRLFDRALTADEIDDLVDLTGRFVRHGTYVSPLYADAAGAPLRLALGQWTGIAPAGLAASLAAEVAGYPDADGAGPESALPLGASGSVADLSPLGPVRSFRYRVHFAADAEPVLDSPVFESAWLTLRRRGTAPRWISRE